MNKELKELLLSLNRKCSQSEFYFVWTDNMEAKWMFDVFCGTEYEQAPVEPIARFTMLEF